MREVEESFDTTAAEQLEVANSDVAVVIESLNLFYGDKQVLKDINLKVPKRGVTAFIGPSGCGKSTLLRCFNRMNDLVDDCFIEGCIEVFGHNVMSPKTNINQLRQQVGMVFQRPNPFPKSIFENVVFGLRLRYVKSASVK